MATVVVFAGMVGVLEAWARWRLRASASGQHQGHLVPHPVLNHTWRPNFSHRHRGYPQAGIEPYEHHYNAQAWVEHDDVAPEKPANTYRVFYLGDSFTEGTCAMERSMPSLVEASLIEELAPGGTRVEVINTGTSSYSPLLTRLLFQTEVLPLDPDLIVIVVDMTDVFDDFLYEHGAVRDETGELIAAPPSPELARKYFRTTDGLGRKPWTARTAAWLRQRSAFFDTVIREAERRRPPDTTRRQFETDPDLPGLFDWCSEEWSAQTEELVANTLQHLRATVRLARAHDVRVAVTAVPHLQHFTGEWSERPFDAIRQACADEGVAYLDSFRGLRERLGDDDPREVFIPNNMHFNERGYREWADAQLEALRQPELRLLPAP